MNAKIKPAAGCVTCDFEPFVKNNYFTGKMMGAAEFIVESHYHQEKIRLHQARLHGWGVACGLLVLQHPNTDCQKRYVRVEPGSAVDCCGNDILVPEEEMLDLLSFAPVVALSKENPSKLHALGICIRFTECGTEQVPVLYDDCGCDDDGCAPNRILESYAFDVIVDPPLAGRRRQALADLSAALYVRSPEPSLGANTPRFGLAPVVSPTSGDTLLYAVDAEQPNKLLTFDLSTLHAHNIDLKAPVYAVGAQGAFAFAATGPQTGTKPLIQILQPGASPLPPVEVTGAATNTLSLGVSTDPNRAAIAYVRESGDLFAFAADATNGLALPPTALGTVATGLTSLTTKLDGSAAYAIDSTATVQVITLINAGSTTTPLGLLPAAAKPTSLGLLTTATQSWLLVASRTDQTLYVVDTAANTLLATLALDHPPEYVTATDPGMIYVVEEEGGAQYLQAIDAAPLASAKPAILEGARLIGGTGLRIVALEKDSTAALLTAAAAVDGTCDELVWTQLAECGDCGSPNCVTLATIERYQAGATVLDADPNATLADDLTNLRARIDNREGRRVLASTATLQAWLECLQSQPGDPGPAGPAGPQGQQGPPGIGLYTDLPKILDIGWNFEETRNLQQLLSVYNSILTSTAPAPADKLKQLVQAGGATLPPLTIYFNKPMQGITRRTLTVTIDAPMPGADGKGGFGSAGVYLPIVLKMYGEIVEITGGLTTPHTAESAPYAVSFLPASQFFFTIDAQGNQKATWPITLVTYLTYLNAIAHIDQPRILVELNGDFVYAPDINGNYTEFGVLDGENIGGRVGQPPPAARQPPITGGKNPSGNLTQGGLFSSWFFLTFRDGSPGPLHDAASAAPIFQSYGASALSLPALPPTANFSSSADLAAAGVPADLAQKIVAERRRKPISGASDLRSRLKLSADDWNQLSKKLLIL